MADIVIKVTQVGVKEAASALDGLNKRIDKVNKSKVTVETSAVKKGTETVKESNKALKAHEGILESIKKNACWYFISGGVAAATKAFKDAIATMKEVDSQLVTVRKVTNATAAEMKALEDQAYKTASAYGVTADQYLSSVAAFARAGYKNQSADLAELAVKTQLVGDVSEDVANQFLLSVDAAYQLNGSVTELSKVLDGANEIDNNYATSIEKIAEGLGIIAPVAAQAHVGIDELSAALGTITAVTQRSGSEAARALRALFLNIMGDTTTEIEDGATWTAGEIEGLRDVIKQYAADAYEAAEATGSVINPMEAIAGLSKSMKDGLLTEQQLMSMVSDIGGKLRTSQLLAIVENWDTVYEPMLNSFNNSVGSADKEVTNALDSWDAKLNILKNTWTEFVQNTVDTEWIKTILDMATGLLTAVNDLGTALMFVASIVIALKGHKIAAGIGSFIDTIKLFAMEVKSAGGGLKGLQAGLLAAGGAATTASLAFAGVTLAIGLASAAYHYWKRKQEESRQAALEAAQAGNEQVQTLESLKQEYIDIADSDESAAEKSKALYEWKQKLVEQYGFEEEALKNVNLERKTGIALMDQELAKEAETTWAKTRDEYQKAEKELARVAGESMLPTPEAYDGGTIEAYDDLIKKMEEFGIVAREEGGLFEFYTEGFETAEDRVNALAEALNYLKDLNESGAGNFLTQGLADAVQAELNRTQKIIDTYSENYAAGLEARINNIIYNGIDGIDIAGEIFKVEDQEGYDALQEMLGGLNLSKAEIEALQDKVAEFFPEFAQGAEDAANGIRAMRTEIDSVAAAISETAEAIQKNIKTAADAFAEFNENGGLSYSTLADIQDAFSNVDGISDYITQLSQTGITADEVEGILSDLVLAKVEATWSTEELAAADETLVAKMLDEAGVANSVETANYLIARAKASVVGATEDEIDAAYASIDAMQREGAISQQTATALRQLVTAQSILSNSKLTLGQQINELSKFTSAALGAAAAAEFNYWVSYAGNLQSLSDGDVMKIWQGIQKKYSSVDFGIDIKTTGSSGSSHSSGGSSGGGSSSSSSSASASAEDAQLEALKDRVSLLKAELSLLEAQDRPISERVAKQMQIMQAIGDQADYMSRIGADQEELTDLTTEWYNVLNDIRELQKDLMDELEEYIDGQLSEAADARDAAIEKLKAEQEAEDDLLTLEEKRKAVLEAQNALLSAQEERTVRIYNAATGQWEWVANAASVKSAQDALDEAKKNLADYEKDRALQEEIDRINAAYDAIEERWNKLKEDRFEEKDRTAEEIVADLFKTFGTSDITGLVWNNVNPLLEALAAFTGSMKKYDSGGVLHGMGGIKATSRDEIVLPPEIAEKMLAPAADQMFRSRVSELAYLYGTTPRVNPPMKTAASSSHTINGGQYNGDVYEMNGYTLTTQQAKSMTVYDFVQMSRGLGIYNNT